MLARKITSSGSTKRAGRSTRSVAPFSIGSFGAATSARGTCAWARSESAAAAAAEAARRSVSRRVMMYAIDRFLPFFIVIEFVTVGRPSFRRILIGVAAVSTSVLHGHLGEPRSQ